MLLYLASASPRRREILKKMGVPFRVVKSRYHEKHRFRLSPAALVLLHAQGKAREAVLPKAARFVLGADTLVYARKKILGKPKTEKEAMRMIALISGKAHAVYTGVALWDRKTRRVEKAFLKTKVYVKKISEKEAQAYIRKVNSLDKAGAYAIQKKPQIVTKIKGSRSNVVGLPEELVRKLMRKVKV